MDNAENLTPGQNILSVVEALTETLGDMSPKQADEVVKRCIKSLLFILQLKAKVDARQYFVDYKNILLDPSAGHSSTITEFKATDEERYDLIRFGKILKSIQ